MFRESLGNVDRMPRIIVDTHSLHRLVHRFPYVQHEQHSRHMDEEAPPLLAYPFIGINEADLRTKRRGYHSNDVRILWETALTTEPRPNLLGIGPEIDPGISR